MSLDQLEGRAAAAIDFAASIGRPLLSTERDSFRFLLIAAKCTAVKRALTKMKPPDVAAHERLIERLRRLVNLDPETTLAALESKTLTFLHYVGELSRPFLKSECRAFGWLLEEWLSRSVKAALAELPDERLEYYWSLHAQVREIIEPDPVERLRLQRNKPAMEIELNDGNFSPKTPAFYGVSVRRISAREATERLALLAKMCDNCGVIAQELALVRNQDRPEAARMVKLGNLMVKRAKAFAARCKADPGIPAERSLAEVMAEMQQMNELMAMEAPT